MTKIEIDLDIAEFAEFLQVLRNGERLSLTEPEIQAISDTFWDSGYPDVVVPEGVDKKLFSASWCMGFTRGAFFEKWKRGRVQ